MWLRYRRAVALAEALVILSIPFLRIRGESALRFDLGGLKLHFFGTVIWIREFYLFLMATVFLIVLFVTVTNVLGRVWCGWLCPQTVLIDAASDLGRALSKRKAVLIEKVLLIPVSALVAASLIWYFVPPSNAIRAIPEGGAVTVFFISLWAAIYGMLALLGRKFCTTICPYSMFQSSLFDSDTLVVAFYGLRQDECMGCEKCLRNCPVGIDIREGLKRECIACARCIDACTSMTGKRRVAPFVGYTGRMLRPKAFWLASAALVAGAVFVGMLYMRADAEIVVIRDLHQPAKGINSYSYMLQNNSDREIVLHVSLKGPFTLLGDTAIEAGPYSVKRGNLLVKSQGDAKTVGFIFRSDGIIIETEAGFL